MDFLEQIRSRDAKLKAVHTRITRPDGKIYIESSNDRAMKEDESGSGEFFVVDTRPDDAVHEIIIGLFIGSQDAACNFEELKKHGIKNILNVAVGAMPPKTDEINYLDLPVYDTPEFNIRDHFVEGVSFIKDCLKNSAILVHCNAGISRSTAMVVAYLMQEKGMKLDCALELVKKARPICKPNPGFMKQLRLFEKEINKQC